MELDHTTFLKGLVTSPFTFLTMFQNIDDIGGASERNISMFDSKSEHATPQISLPFHTINSFRSN